MASVGTLYTYPDFIFGKIILTVAGYGDLPLDIPDDYIHHESNRKPEYIAKFASGKIPAFEDKDGFTLFETIPIARYLASLSPNSGLLGNGPKDQALIDQWVHYIEQEVAANITFLVAVLKGRMNPYSKPLQQFWTDPLFKSLDILEKHLSTRTFYVGERITLADIVSAYATSLLVNRILDASLRPKYTNLIRHFETVVNHPKIKPTFGEITYIEKAIQYIPPSREKKEAKPAPAPQA